MKTTSIRGPFDNIDYDDKAKVQAMVPQTWAYKVFKIIFPRKGAQDKIIASLLNTFMERCRQVGLPDSFELTNEKIAQKVLTEFEKLIK